MQADCEQGRVTDHRGQSRDATGEASAYAGEDEPEVVPAVHGRTFSSRIASPVVVPVVVIVMVMAVWMVVAVRMVVLLGVGFARTGRRCLHSTARLAVIPAAVLAISDLVQVVLDGHAQLRGEGCFVGAPVRPGRSETRLWPWMRIWF